jgi:uncharacterized membrane-anchored protein
MKTKTRLGFILIVLFQVLILVGWTGYNEISLATGKEVVLQTVPVDPMDIFRGEYVQLRYTISTLSNIPGITTAKNGEKVYVRLEQDGEVWKAAEVGHSHDSWDEYIAGQVVSTGNSQIALEYGIEAYFVPQGKGPEIQRARDIKARIVINGSGQAFIKGLIVDGKPFQLH